MRKIALSLAVVAASGGYVWSQWDGSASDDPLAALSPLGSQSPIGSAEARALDPQNDDLSSNDLQTGSIGERQPAFMTAPEDTETLRKPAVEDAWSDDDGAWSDDEEEEHHSEFRRPLGALSTGDAFASPRAPASIAMTAPAIAAAPETPSHTSQDEAAVASPQLAELTALPFAPVTPIDTPQSAPTIVEARLPRPRPAYQPPVVNALLTQTTARSAPIVQAASRSAPSGRYQDGTFTGPPIDAFYGLVQIQAIVQGGRLVDINVLRYPSDRRLSVRINRYALPRLRDEAVSVQSANVDIISGATLTSEAFIRSIRTALRGATGA